MLLEFTGRAGALTALILSPSRANVARVSQPMARVLVGELAGLYEVRVRQGRTLFRLLYLLERDADDLGGPSFVCLGGLSKQSRSAADPRDYAAIKQFAAEFRRHRTVM